jgi:hypothetical protein
VSNVRERVPELAESQHGHQDPGWAPPRSCVLTAAPMGVCCRVALPPDPNRPPRAARLMCGASCCSGSAKAVGTQLCGRRRRRRWLHPRPTRIDACHVHLAGSVHPRQHACHPTCVSHPSVLPSPSPHTCVRGLGSPAAMAVSVCCVALQVYRMDRMGPAQRLVDADSPTARPSG